jgi:hypothetical protein
MLRTAQTANKTPIEKCPRRDLNPGQLLRREPYYPDYTTGTLEKYSLINSI